MQNPKVTIGMPAFNRSIVLEETIKQVLNQTYKNFEFIIFNDGSTDKTLEIIKSFKDDRIIFINSKINLGPPHPLNEILKISKGDYIIILHDHDIFNPELIEQSVIALEKNPSSGFVLQGSAWIDEDGISKYRSMLLNLNELNNGKEYALNQLREKSFNNIFHACSMVKRTAFKKCGFYYDIKYGLYADLDLWYRLLLHYDFVYINKVLMTFRQREAYGHFLSGKELEILNTVYSINIKNLSRFYPTTSNESKYYYRNITKNWKRSVLKTTLFSASKNNKIQFLDGLKILTNKKFNIFINIIAKVIIKFPLIQKLIIKKIINTNRIRKWLIN